MSGTICVEVKSAIGVITLDNEAKRNAMTQAMWLQLIDVIKQLAADANVRVVIIRGRGEQAFSAGADISEFSTMAQFPERLAENNEVIQQAQMCLEKFNKPTLAMIYGACVGGGCGLALACDFRFAAASAKFAITPAKLGLLYSKNDTRRLYNLVGPALCRDLLFTGRVATATEAKAIGLISDLVDADKLIAHVMAFAENLASASQYSLRGIKQVLASIEGYGSLSDAELQVMFDQAFASEDCVEGVAAFLEKRQAKFRWQS